jgi:hypothetical protein
LAGRYIAIGYNPITLFDINSAKYKTGNGFNEDKLATRIMKAYPEELRPKYIATQLIDFTYSIKRGDIVVIPSENSEFLSFGEVTQGITYNSEKNDNCPFVKRKRVNYIKKNVPIDSLDPHLFRLKYIQRTVTKLDEYTNGIIDKTTNTLFIKNNNAHLVLNIEQQGPIKATGMFQTWLDIFDIAEGFGKQEGIQMNKDDLDVRINLQSPGSLEFINYSIQAILLVTVVVTALIGAEFESSNKVLPIKFKSDGLIKKMTDYLNAKTDRKLKQKLIDKLGEMDIKTEDMRNMLKQIKGIDSKDEDN